jgi:hypothetical protein
VSVFRGPPEPEPPKVPAGPPGSPRLRIAAGLLESALGVFWIAMAGLLFNVSVDNRPGGAPFVVFAVGVPCLVVGLYTGYAGWATFRRAYNVQGQLVFASILGVGWGIFLFLLIGLWYLLLPIPFHALVGVFALGGSRYFEPDWC